MPSLVDSVTTPDPPRLGPVDARAMPRQQTIFLIGRIVAADVDSLCLVRNISPHGVGVEHDGRLMIGAEIGIETRTMLPTRAVVRWSRGEAAGLEFLEPPRDILCEDWRTQGRVLRSPRFRAAYDGAIVAGGRLVPVRIADIALGGARLHGDVACLSIGPARVDLGDAIAGIPGRIRWIGSHDAGFQFAEPLSSRELSFLLDSSAAVIQ